MIIAITMRYGLSEKKTGKYWIDENMKKIFENLGILLFPVYSSKQASKIANLCDGLIITGSPIHIDAKKYGKDNLNPVDKKNQEIDKLDFTLIREFHSVKKPILGICRGIQVLNVYFGGNLNQKIENHQIPIKEQHKVNISPDSKIYEYFKANSILVNSLHSQAIEDLAENFKVTARSDDGIIEAIEFENIIGVQWHPEHMLDYGFFDFFVKICTKNNHY